MTKYYVPNQGIPFISQKTNRIYYYDPVNDKGQWQPFNLKYTIILPDDWEVRNSSKGTTYFYQNSTGISQYKMPDGSLINYWDLLSEELQYEIFKHRSTSNIADAYRGYRSSKRLAEFHNIAPKIFPNYERGDSSRSIVDLDEDINILVKEYIIKHKIPDGDIIFMGSSYESRQEYGFGIVDRREEDFYGSDKERFYSIDTDYTIEDVVGELAEEYNFENIDYRLAIRQIHQFVQKPYYEDILPDISNSSFVRGLQTRREILLRNAISANEVVENYKERLAKLELDRQNLSDWETWDTSEQNDHIYYTEKLEGELKYAIVRAHHALQKLTDYLA